MLRKPTKRRAVSPVIATVILVAVTITVAVAVSYWMSGITGAYTSFEKVEIQSALCDHIEGTPDYWEIEILLKNSGTKTATLTTVFVNDAVACLSKVGPTTTTDESGITAKLGDPTDPYIGDVPLQIMSGATGLLTVWIEDTHPYLTLSSGTTVNIKIHSAAGMDYIKLVQLV